MGQLEELSKFLEGHVDEERVRDAVMAAKMEEMSKQIQTLTDQVEMLVTSWNQARGIITFVKWFASIAGGVTAFLLFIKDHMK